MINQEYWDSLYDAIVSMTDEEFMEALEDAGLSKCPFAIEGEDDVSICINPSEMEEEQ